MNFQLYKDKQDILLDPLFPFAQLPRGFEVDSYDAVSTQNYVFKFTDGEKSLLALRFEQRVLLLIGSESLAPFAANVIANYHLQVGACLGSTATVTAFNLAYNKRLGGSIKQALFAGGCFWCMAKPYYEYDGVIKVFSGYAGGSEVNPTYEQVKKGLTHHRETVMLEYDSAVISFKQLLDIYFYNIDPFDEGGQFIDRGDNYTCAIYTDDVEERSIATEYINDIEARYNRKVQVKVLGNQVFYMAEEYHQDYALKNPDAMQQELKASGRLNNKK